MLTNCSQCGATISPSGGLCCGLGFRSATELCEQLGFDSDAMTGKTFSIHGEKQKGGDQ
jgi:hypothetical protein